MQAIVRRFRPAGYFAGAASAVLVAFAPGQAAAQNSTGFAVNRFDPSERGSDWFWAESLDLRGHNRWAFGVVGDWAYKPLVSYDQDGNEQDVLIRHQVYAHLGASVVFWDRLRLAANLPILAYQTGDDVTLGGESFSAPENPAVGDARLGADVRVVGEYGGPATVALGAQVHIPTGSQEAYTSDGASRLVPRATLAGDLGIFTYAVKTGVNLRFEGDSFAGAAFGHEWTFGGAAGLRLLDKKLTVGPEIWASTVIEDGSDGFFQEESTPLEGVFGAHYRLPKGWRVGAGIGPGFTQGLGSPQLRTLASVEWLPEPEEEPTGPVDTDGDGIFDPDDACVNDPGPRHEDPAKHGCPLPDDSDGDGIIDEKDSCPDVPGESNEANPELHGCPPPPDTDGDGILDLDDACVEEAGEANDDLSKHGCPAPVDTDGDGIFDPDDKCVDQAGPANEEDASQHGCPKAQLLDGQVRIMDRIEFDTGSADIRDVSEPVLNAVLKVLQEHADIKKVRIEGHTDNRGGAWLNKDLSRRRAAAVRKWLIEKGIDEGRLTSTGIGPDRPIDTNDTDEGRQNNRRVEFHILEESK